MPHILRLMRARRITVIGKFLTKIAPAGNGFLTSCQGMGWPTGTLGLELAHSNKYTAVLSHRSGETEDATIVDIAVATNCAQIKTGSLSRSDRLASKTNSSASNNCSARTPSMPAQAHCRRRGGKRQGSQSSASRGAHGVTRPTQPSQHRTSGHSFRFLAVFHRLSTSQNVSVLLWQGRGFTVG